MSEPLILAALVAAAIVLQVLLKTWLAQRQVRHVQANRGAVPPAFQSAVSLAAHQRAADYTVAKSRLGSLELLYGTLVLIGWTFGGGLHALNQILLAIMGPGLAQQLVLIGGFAAVSAVLDLPFSLYQTFVVEQRFGFNRMTLWLWLADALKGALLSTLIGLPLAALVLWIMQAAGSGWWLWAWAVWTGFMLLMLVIYPVFIAPLFNKFEPLADEALKTRVTALMRRCGFSAQGFYVMDGSRRSAHANAYFTGFGAAKRVVFFDTLLAKLDAAEVDAVLAHELGHFHHKHIAKRVVVMLATSLAGFALLGWLAAQPWFYSGLGVQPALDGPNNALALLLFLLVVPVFTYFLAPLMAASSRRHEFEADAYAARHADGDALRSALLKLYEDNASTLTPDPLFVRFYYSHPPAGERLARLAAAPV
ncbi:MAG: Protease HtpX [Paracidovorax wautersii]|uniref:Protease HtpX n=1 Tax=Paracidovorax wautersii TaxID=1177982 RepID=A0A7V8JR97_9BURK|nr:MAG: Protease HtpX [Paracidovorax wautersii]